MFVKGLYLAIITVIFWALYDVGLRFSVSALGVETSSIGIACLSLLGGGITLLVVAGPGRLGIAAMRDPYTWQHGLFQLLTTVFYTIGLTYITATEANIIGRMNIIMSIILAWMFLQRSPTKWDGLGMLILAGGIGLMIWDLPPETKWIAVSIYVISSFFATIRTLTAEVHTTSNATRTVKERCRVTGVVLLLTSLILMLVLIAMAAMKQSIPADAANQLEMLGLLPDMSTLLNRFALTAGLLTGALFLSGAMYTYFYATRLVKTENFLMIITLLPFATYAIEMVAASVGLVDASEVSAKDLLAASMVVCGAMFMVYMRHKEAKEELSA